MLVCYRAASFHTCSINLMQLIVSTVGDDMIGATPRGSAANIVPTKPHSEIETFDSILHEVKEVIAKYSNVYSSDDNVFMSLALEQVGMGQYVCTC